MNWEKRFTKWIGSRTSVVIHTLFFLTMFCLVFLGLKVDIVLLVLTTLVSLEAIYLSIFIQMTVNQNTDSLHDVEEEIEELVEDVGEISEDIDEIQQDVDEIQHDVDEMEKENNIEEQLEKKEKLDLESIQAILKKLVEEVERLKSNIK